MHLCRWNIKRLNLSEIKIKVECLKIITSIKQQYVQIGNHKVEQGVKGAMLRPCTALAGAEGTKHQKLLQFYHLDGLKFF